MVKVSVICTNYNYSQYLGRALESFIAQQTTFPFEIIVVDDCSTDNSRDILQDYAQRYPELLRVFFNQTNKGITRTWIDICQEARGQYLARCDADDYWVTPDKLQKQVDLLESTPDSRWCNTDFNIVDESDRLLHEQVFQNGPIAYANTYEKMLATKGMTLPSSWLVETSLMQEVSQKISTDAVDDTFNLQLEMFQKTNLSFLPEVTVAYRMTQNSDSRPKDLDKMSKRVNGLMATQLEYLEKYPEQDLLTIAKLQIEREAWQEIRVISAHMELNSLQARVAGLEQELAGKAAEANYYQRFYEETLDAYNRVITSRRWTIPTKLLAFFRRKK